MMLKEITSFPSSGNLQDIEDSLWNNTKSKYCEAVKVHTQNYFSYSFWAFQRDCHSRTVRDTVDPERNWGQR